MLEDQYFLDADEIGGARKVLSAAAMTYVCLLYTSADYSGGKRKRESDRRHLRQKNKMRHHHG